MESERNNIESFRPPEEALDLKQNDLVKVAFLPYRGRIEKFEWENGARIATVKCADAPGGKFTARLDQLEKIED